MESIEQYHDLRTTEIFANEIVFFGRERVVIYGFYLEKGQFHETCYELSRRTLQTLLSLNGPVGVELLWHIEQLFMYPHHMPAHINLVDMFGITQPLKARSIFIERPLCEDERGELKPVNSYDVLFIAQVMPFAGPVELAF
ncbi:MAG: hypothetical protein U0T75_01080 [Chitinophagales bacterium]